MSMIVPILVMSGLGAAMGVGLAVAAKYLSVVEDPRVEALADILPGANCGACGYPGCNGYAKALANGDDVTLCSPGGNATVQDIAQIMGVAAVFTATNTMLAALASRTHEIGVLLSIGFRPFPIFLSFLMEAVILGLLGGLVGVLLTLPLSGIETGTTNFQTFTEVAFAFRVTPSVLTTAVSFALVLGLIAGAWPAWRAAHMDPVDAMRRG